MIVTTGAGQRQPQKGRTDRFDPLFPFLRDDLLDHQMIELQFLPIGRAESEKTERRIVLRLRIGEQVRRKLLPHEIVVGQVCIERPRDPIAIEPGLGDSLAPRFRHVTVAGQVEPVPAPTLAILRRGQIAIDQPLIGIGAGSFTNSSISSRVGGRPSKSNFTRRINTERDAGGEGCKFRGSWPASRNRSVRVRGQFTHSGGELAG